ncbi:mannitol-1-phosphate 5-dehydrogenase [Oceanobacillus jeddahense]|uniref:Mannitol-1-phosphate 5-dehydrogenase n=1 Tax=Oceanobacillus jeddahense TaxID=1462527 RepID=A0ABY5JV87_9BACI|nr:mannitol-1-phosphate 5-dehydrogenase [Oceanobacillus jeddahense]UUI02996.1 mannitol-1-phosphate 5-dehydrogenase [Oceanobacillus jeddahense]
MKAIHFGAGNIGRGFIGQVLHDNNFELIFIDTNNTIIDQLNQDKGYNIELLDSNQTQIYIDNVSALHSVKEADKVIELIDEGDIITTSVGAHNLVHISPIIKKGLIKRAGKKKTINILANENMINASDLLREEIKKICDPSEWDVIEETAYFANTSIDRQALSKETNGKQIAIVEPYYEWIIEKNKLDPNANYSLKNVKMVSNMKPYIERKLFLVNACHAAFAYLGSLFDYATVQESIKDHRINRLVRQFLAQNIAYFLKEYQMDKDELKHFVDKTIARQGNTALSDDVHRVGRSPKRKLGPFDRLIFPIKKLDELNLENDKGKRIAVAAYCYQDKNDKEAIEIQNMISEQGIIDTVKKVSQVSNAQAQELSEIYYAIHHNRENIFLEEI